MKIYQLLDIDRTSRIRLRPSRMLVRTPARDRNDAAKVSHLIKYAKIAGGITTKNQLLGINSLTEHPRIGYLILVLVLTYLEPSTQPEVLSTSTGLSESLAEVKRLLDWPHLHRACAKEITKIFFFFKKKKEVRD